MNNFIFRMPRDCPALTYDGLWRYMAAKGGDPVRIGTTVMLQWHDTHVGPYVEFILYGTTLAAIFADRVDFTAHGDRHNATGCWLDQIARDNGLGSVYRENWVRYLYPLEHGSARVPLEGHSFPVNHDACVTG